MAGVRLDRRRRTPGRACALVLLTALLAGGFGGCAAPPRTTLILLPDEDGKVGRASLITDEGTLQLDEAFSATSVTARARTPSNATALGQSQVDARYAGMLAIQPLSPRTFTLHFLLDRAVLTEASKAQLPELLRAARERKPTEISLFGHADASGTRERNLRLSAERAQMVADWLRQSDPSLDRLQIRAFGSAEPLNEPGLAPTDPRHRRVEVLIL